MNTNNLQQKVNEYVKKNSSSKQKISEGVDLSQVEKQEYEDQKDKLPEDIKNLIKVYHSQLNFVNEWNIYNMFKRYDFNKTLMDSQVDVMIQRTKTVDSGDWINVTTKTKKPNSKDKKETGKDKKIKNEYNKDENNYAKKKGEKKNSYEKDNYYDKNNYIENNKKNYYYNNPDYYYDEQYRYEDYDYKQKDYDHYEKENNYYYYNEKRKDSYSNFKSNYNEYYDNNYNKYENKYYNKYDNNYSQKPNYKQKKTINQTNTITNKRKYSKGAVAVEYVPKYEIKDTNINEKIDEVENPQKITTTFLKNVIAEDKNIEVPKSENKVVNVQDSENLPTTHVSQPKTDKKSHVHHHNQTPLKPTPPLNISNVTHQQIQPNLSNPAPNTNTGQILLLVQLPNGTQIPLPVTPASNELYSQLLSHLSLGNNYVNNNNSENHNIQNIPPPALHDSPHRKNKHDSPHRKNNQNIPPLVHNDSPHPENSSKSKNIEKSELKQKKKHDILTQKNFYLYNPSNFESLLRESGNHISTSNK